MSRLLPALERGRDFLRRQLLEAEYPLLAVEVRPRGLGVARLAREGGKFVLAAAASADIPPGVLSLSMTEPNLTDPEAFERLLASLLERAGALREGPVALVLPDPVARLTVLPASELLGKRGADAEEMARFRLRKTVPFEIKDARLALGLPPRGGPDAAVVAAILRPVLESYEAVLHRLGLAPGLVELSSLALLSLLEPAAGDRLLVNWDEGYASLVLARDGWPMLVRTLPDVAATPEALPREVANTLLYYRERLGGPGLAGAAVRCVALPPDEAADLLEEPLGLLPAVIDPWATLGGGERRPGQAVAGAVAVALRATGRAA